MPRGPRRLPDGCLRRLGAADLIVHAGDLSTLEVLDELRALGEVVAVHGNVDSSDVRMALPAAAEVAVGPRRLAVIHDARAARGRLDRLRGRVPAAPTARRGLPSVLVRRGADRIMFDCGEGTQRQLVSTIGLTELTEIFLTHFHADHWLGLPGMLKTFDLRGRERPLTIYGPRGLQALLALVLRMGG